MGLASPATNVALLKRLWGTKVAETIYKRDRLLELCKKDTNFRGEGRYVTVAIAPTAGGSSDFAEAVANQEATVERNFFVQHRKEYHLYTISNEAIERSKGNQAAIVEILKRHVGSAKNSYAEASARLVHGDGGGSLGQLATTVNLASTTLTLRSRTDIVGVFHKNTQLHFAQNNGTGVSPGNTRGPGAKLKVTAIDRDAGSVTVNALLNTVPGITANDYVFRAGDFANKGTGLRGWVPDADPNSDQFFAVDRTEDLARLSGIRVDGGGQPKEDTLQDAGAECQINGIEPKVCLVNSLDFNDVGKELGGQKIQEGGEGVTGFERIICHTAAGPITIEPTPFVKRGSFWMGNPGENFVLGTAGEAPMDLAMGQGTLLLPTADAKQGRIGHYGNCWVPDPGQWLAGTW